MKRLLLLGLAAAACGGCASTDKIVYEKRPPNTATPITCYTEGYGLDRPYRKIAELSYAGQRQDELCAKKRFTQQAFELGGEGFIFRTIYAGAKGGGGVVGANGGWVNGISQKWLFKAEVFVYTAETNSVAQQASP